MVADFALRSSSSYGSKRCGLTLVYLGPTDIYLERKKGDTRNNDVSLYPHDAPSYGHDLFFFVFPL